MKRFELWLTAAIMFSLPALGFAQATGGSPGKLLQHKGGAGTGKKGTAQAEIRKKGTGTAPKTSGTAGPLPVPPKAGTQIESGATGTGVGKVAGTGKKPGKVEPTMSARKRPPHPRPAKVQDKQ